MEIQVLPRDVSRIVFPHIFMMFTNLQYLNFGPSSALHQQLLFGMSFPTVISSNLLKLHIIIFHFNDLLYLLDGRFNQLHTFHVNISAICSNDLTINNQVNYF